MIVPPYDHTMYLDVDMNILNYIFTHLWNDYHKSNDDLYIGGYSDNSNKGRSKWHWHTLYDVIESSNINIPEISSTAFFYNNKFKDYMKNDNNLHYIFNNISNWSVKKQFRGGYPDEIILAIIMGILNIKPHRHFSRLVCCE